MQRDNNFNLLRFLFAAIVILQHSYSLCNIPNPILPYINIAKYAVYGFFIISGYLVTASLERTNDTLIFLRKRLYRIFPGLIVMSAIITLGLGTLSNVNYIDYIRDPATLFHFFATSTLIPIYKCLPGIFGSNPAGCGINGSLWSIRYEVLFYLLLTILNFVKKKNRKHFVSGLLLINILLLFIWNFTRSSIPDGINYHLDRILNLGVYFLGGSILYYNQDILKAWKLHITSALVILLSIILGINEFLLPLALPTLLLAIGNAPKRFSILPAKWGDCSYGMYIYAYPIQQALVQLFEPQELALIFIPALILSVLLGYLSWNFIEKRWKMQKISS